MTAVRRPSRDYVAALLLGLILGIAGYIVVGALWVLNFWIQNVLADLAAHS